MNTQLDPTENSSATNKKVIGFDLDGVFLDFSELKRKLAAERGYDIALNETPSEIMAQKISVPVYKEMQWDLYARPPHAFSVPLIPGAKEGLQKVAGSGVPFFLISRRKFPDVPKKVLEGHGLWPDYFHEQNAFFVIEPKDKDIRAKALGITHYVDDEPKVLQAIESVPHRILFDPFGAYPEEEWYEKVGSWKEILSLLLGQ